MSFSSQTLLIKRQRFDNNKNEERRATKRQRGDMSKDKEMNPDYILLPMPSHQKGTNYPSNLGEETRSLTYLVSI